MSTFFQKVSSANPRVQSSLLSHDVGGSETCVNANIANSIRGSPFLFKHLFKTILLRVLCLEVKKKSLKDSTNHVLKQFNGDVSIFFFFCHVHVSPLRGTFFK